MPVPRHGQTANPSAPTAAQCRDVLARDTYPSGCPPDVAAGDAIQELIDMKPAGQFMARPRPSDARCGTVKGPHASVFGPSLGRSPAAIWETEDVIATGIWHRTVIKERIPLRPVHRRCRLNPLQPRESDARIQADPLLPNQDQEIGDRLAGQFVIAPRTACAARFRIIGNGATRT